MPPRVPSDARPGPEVHGWAGAATAVVAVWGLVVFVAMVVITGLLLLARWLLLRSADRRRHESAPVVVRSARLLECGEGPQGDWARFRLADDSVVRAEVPDGVELPPPGSLGLLTTSGTLLEAFTCTTVD